MQENDRVCTSSEVTLAFLYQWRNDSQGFCNGNNASLLFEVF